MRLPSFLAASRIISLVAMAAALLTAPGCEEKIYDLELRPSGDKIERRLTLSRHNLPDHSPKSLSGENDGPEIRRLAAAYKVDPPKLPQRKAVFSGTFRDALPQDIGGAGRYVHWESPLGRVRIYVERFRGNDDMYSSLEKRRKAVDQIVDLLVGWFESELRGQPEWPTLRIFLDQQFRNDLQNFSLFVWSTNVRDIFESTDALAEVAIRAAQYCVERNYVTYEETPTLRREFEDAQERDNPTALLKRIRQLIVVRAGATETRWKQSLEFLSDTGRLQVSWHRYFWQSPYFKKTVADIGLERRQVLRSRASGEDATSPGSTSDAAEPKPIFSAQFVDAKEAAFLGNLFWSAFAFNSHFLSDVSRVQANLEAPRKPFWTNGKWNDKQRRVEWSPLIAELPKPDGEKSPFSFEWPALCFAVWDEPSDAEQKRIFGRIGLTGHHLLDYCLWYGGLSGLEKKEWEAFLPTIRDNQPASRLKAFLFSGEPRDRKNYQSVASDIATTLTDVYYPKK
ncbi:MAG TPA: hypothetical protein VFG04_23305 [Planctomycetaceae bacterium]|jgi:hypothetical protein|nr:hypothetical protein [Planctomycetaceae bacterium]